MGEYYKQYNIEQIHRDLKEELFCRYIMAQRRICCIWKTINEPWKSPWSLPKTIQTSTSTCWHCSNSYQGIGLNTRVPKHAHVQIL